MNTMKNPQTKLLIQSYRKVLHNGVVYYSCQVDTGAGVHQQLLSTCFKPVTWKSQEEKRNILALNTQLGQI